MFGNQTYSSLCGRYLKGREMGENEGAEGSSVGMLYPPPVHPFYIWPAMLAKIIRRYLVTNRFSHFDTMFDCVELSVIEFDKI